MELEGEITGKTLKMTVYITNTNGGHWVPTGETMRSVMLLLDAVDSNGKQLKMLKGTRLPEWTGVGDVKTGNYAGLVGTVFAKVLKDDNGNIHVPFWRSSGIASDTRIRPKKTVTLEYEFGYESDKFDRLLVYAIVDGQNLNVELVRNGLAEVVIYEKRRKLIYEDELLEAQEYAKENKLGIWSD